MERFVAEHIEAQGFRTCRICRKSKLYFLKSLNICFGCGIKVPKYIPNEQAIKFLLSSKGE